MVIRVLLFILFWSFGNAQTAISRADVMRLAERSASVEVARAKMQSAEAQARAVGAGISGSASGSAAVAGIVPSSGDTILSYPWSLQLNLRFAGVLGEAGDARVQASINLERARRGLVAARIRALSQAVNLWHGLRRGMANLEVAQMALQLALLEDAAAETRLKSGSISLAERERIALALEFAWLEVSRAELRLSGVRLQFEVLFGLRHAVALTVWQALSEPLTFDLEAREDIFEARAAVVLANVQAGAAQRVLLPTLNLEASVRGSAGVLSVSGNQFLALSIGYSYPVALPVGVSSSFSIGLNLSIPIQPLNLSAANRAGSAAQRLLEVVLALAKAEVITARSSLVLAHSTLDLAWRSNEFAARQLERVKARILAGLVSVLDLKRAELDFAKAGLEVLDAQANFDTANLELSATLALVMEAQ